MRANAEKSATVRQSIHEKSIVWILNSLDCKISDNRREGPGCTNVELRRFQFCLRVDWARWPVERIPYVWNGKLLARITLSMSQLNRKLQLRARKA